MFKSIVYGLLVLIAWPFMLAAETLRDPTTPLGYQAENKANPAVILQLNSILISNQRRAVVINGATLHQGEQINGTGFRVVSIKTNSVTVQSSNATRVLSLFDSKVKK